MLQGWTRYVTVAFLPAEKEAASFSGMVTCVLIFPTCHREQQTSRICFLFEGKLLIIMKALTGGNALHQVAQLKTLIVLKNKNIRNWSYKKRGHFRTVTFKLLKKRLKEGKKVREITNA